MTPEIRVDCPDAHKFELVARVQRRLVEYAKSKRPLPGLDLTIRDVVTIDGIRISFDDGWGLIRASNTQPALVLRFEASTPERLAVIRTVIESELESAKRSLER